MLVMIHRNIHLKVNKITFKIFLIQMDETKSISLINIRLKSLQTFKNFKICMKIHQCKQTN